MKKNMKKNMLWMLLSLMAAAIMMPLSATAQTRIAVVSDIHVMAPSLLPNEAKTKDAWKNYYAGQRKMLEQSADLFDQFVTTMISEAPDVLLITGDLTKDGEQLSHNYVKAGLETLKDAGIKVYVIPGNHDFGDEGNHTQFNADGSTGNADPLPKTGENGFASFYADYGYSGSTPDDTEGNSLSYVAEPVSGLVLLAIDSHSGSVNPATLTWICNQALSARAAGKRVIAMMHHPLFPHITGAELFAESYTVANYKTVRNALIAAGVNVILTGHFHTSDIAYDWIDNPNDDTDKSNGIYDINTGSLISYPCDYRMLTLSADKSTLSVNTYSLPAESETKVFWENWLHGRVKTIATNKMNKKAGNLAVLAREQIEAIAEFAANLFILHAKGDENSSQHDSERGNLQSTYTGFTDSFIYSGALSYGGITDESIYSILTDISNYVDGEPMSGHENRTDDRELTEEKGNRITLTPPGTGTLNSILNLLDNEDNRAIINLYHETENVTVTLSGRTFLKDNAWNTICLPFDVTIGDSQLQGAEARALTGASITEGTGGTTLNLTFSNPVTKLDAGRPYIIKWESGENITTDLTFTNVTINKTMLIDGDEDYITFRGTYAWQQFTDENPTILLIGKNATGNSTLFYPIKGISLASLGAFRAYFQLADGYTAGESIEGGGGTIRNFVLNFGDDDSATGIIAIGDSQLSTLNAQRSEWFTLDGRRLAAKPTAKGLYIHAGRKVVIK